MLESKTHEHLKSNIVNAENFSQANLFSLEEISAGFGGFSENSANFHTTLHLICMNYQEHAAKMAFCAGLKSTISIQNWISKNCSVESKFANSNF